MGRYPLDGMVTRLELLSIAYSRIQDSFYKVLSPQQHMLAHRNEYDFDSPSSIDFDILVERLEGLKAG